MDTTSPLSNFSEALRYWRGKRGYSQLQLSGISGVSQRHLSFLESGRSQPSRALILSLGNALDIPLRHRNTMLLAAGFAPAYRERPIADPALAAVQQALEFMLSQQAPFPALVVDRLWNLQMANEPAAGLMRWLLGMPPGAALPAEVNVLALMIDLHGVGRHVVNLAEVRADLLHWIEREAMSDGPGSEATDLLARLHAIEGPSQAVEPDLDRLALPFIPVHLHKDGIDLRLFSTIATLGTPRDVTLHELRIESFFPADAATAAWFRERY